MTRDEVYFKLVEIVTSRQRQYNPQWRWNFEADKMVGLGIDTLEALGLIKFDKIEANDGNRFVVQMAEAWTTTAIGLGEISLSRAIVHDLDAAGFEIKRKA